MAISSSTKAIIIAVFASILMSLSQILWKLGAESSYISFAVLTNIPLISGFALYGFCAILMVIALRNGELSAVYPIFAMSFVLVNFLAWLILYESMNIFKWLGVIAVITGITIIGLSQEHKKQVRPYA